MAQAALSLHVCPPAKGSYYVTRTLLAIPGIIVAAFFLILGRQCAAPLQIHLTVIKKHYIMTKDAPSLAESWHKGGESS